VARRLIVVSETIEQPGPRVVDGIEEVARALHPDAFGAAVALSEGCADPTGPKALRASAGAIFRVPLGGFGDRKELPRIALVPRDGVPLPELELPERVIFALGAEREGLPDDVLDAADSAATIPQAGRAESLNVATAGAIALYEWRRGRGR